MKRLVQLGNIFLFGFFFGMTLSHIINGFVWSAVGSAMVTLLFVPGMLLNRK